jgi:SAM-dependent methyltransferase
MALSEIQMNEMQLEDKQSRIDEVLTSSPSSIRDLLFWRCALLRRRLKTRQPEAMMPRTAACGLTADISPCAYCSRYFFAAAEERILVSMQGRHQDRRCSSFDLLDLTQPDASLNQPALDLLVIKAHSLSSKERQNVLQSAWRLLASGGYVLIIDAASDHLAASPTNEVPEDPSFSEIRNLMPGYGFENVRKLDCAGKASHFS